MLFAAKLANFLMFTISKENTVNLEGSSDIFGNGQTTSFVSEIFDSLRESSEAFGNLLK